MENIGEKIYKLRTEKGVSQESLAEELNVARFTVSRWETNTANPTTENIKNLCEFFGVASTYFFGDNEEITEAKADPAKQVKEIETVKKDKFKTLKILSIATGIVLLAFLVVVCGISAYITISPGAGGEWSEEIHIVNYEGIIILAVGAVAVAVFIILSILLFFKIKKKKRE